MEKEYKINVMMTPHKHDNPTYPYFWCILENQFKENPNYWANAGCGWAENPQKAWDDAIEYYNEHFNQL